MTLCLHTRRPKFYGLPKIHKANMPMRPIVSSIGSITYNCSKHLAELISPLIGKTDHHIKNSLEFSRAIKEQTVDQEEELRSYDVTALFTSVPVDKAVECCLLYTSPSPRDLSTSRMPSSA